MRADDDYRLFSDATAIVDAKAAAVHPDALEDAIAFLLQCRPDLIPGLVVDDRIEDRESLFLVG